MPNSTDPKLSNSPLANMAMNELGGMGAESGFDPEDSSVPLRISGFISLLLGLISWVTITAVAAIVIPIMGFAFGLFALRSSGSKASGSGKPTGTLAARLGMILAVGFGACGLALPMLKTRTLGEQAKQFSLRYIDVVNRGYDEVGIELKKEHRNRFSKEMPLEDHYAGQESSQQALGEFRGDGANAIIRSQRHDAPWVLDRPIRVYLKYGIDRADVIWKSEDGKRIHFFMQYQIDGNDVGQWHIGHCQPYRELIVAEVI